MTEMKRRRIIVLNEDVLYEKELTLAEKFVYARIAGFEEYFESADECAELLGISVSTVQKAKSKLEKLGYITCIRNTGRGKAYRAVLDRQCEQPEGNKSSRGAWKKEDTPRYKLEQMMKLDEDDLHYCDVIRKRYWQFVHNDDEDGWQEGGQIGPERSAGVMTNSQKQGNYEVGYKKPPKNRQCEPDSQNLLIRLANSANQTRKICEHSNDLEKNIDLSTYVDKGDNVASETVNESNSQKATKPTYGNSDINGMFDFWQTQVGTPIISREKSNRRACYNLLRNKHIGEEKLRHAVEFVGKIKEDRFAPRISDFVDLQGKFNELCAYKTKYQAQQDVSGDKTPNKAVSSAMKGNNYAGGNVEFVPWRPTAGDLEREREWNEKERRQTEESAKVDPEWLEKLKQETIRKIYSHGDRK